MQKNTSVEVIQAMKGFPYFVIKNEIETGYNLYIQEMNEIKQNYIDYKKGADFTVEGTAGSYIGSDIRFKQAKILIDKEARFMFSQTPDINIQSNNVGDEKQDRQIEQYQKLVNEVLFGKKGSNFGKQLLQSAKDCFIGKRVACLVDYSTDYGIKTHFYNALQFYYEIESDSEQLIKFVSFESLNKTKSNSEKLYLVNKYVLKDKVYMSSVLYNGTGKVVNNLIPEHETDLDYIPAVVITNDGILEEKGGTSEIESLTEYESGYSRLSNADIDSERKGMNPVRYTVDMNSETTKNLSSGAGAYWDLRHDQNMNDPSPSVGTLAPAMNHTEAVKTTLDRIRSAMYNEVDVPDISKDGLLSGITSFKALKALYYPLTIRSNEKLKTWKPAIQFVVQTIIDLAVLNKSEVIGFYVLTGLDEVQYKIKIEENYALLDDETEEKETDLAEINAKARSRKSYIKKWRGNEFTTDAQIDEELMQIAIEENMFDTMSMNTQVQTELNKRATNEQIENNLENIKTEQTLTE